VISIETKKVVGVAFSHRINASLMCFIISTPVLKMFIEAYDFDKRRNFGCLPEVGFLCEELKNVSHRKRALGNKFSVDNFYGCLVSSVEEFLPANDLIKVGDVLLEVEGCPVSENGEVHHRNHEWLPYEWLITKKSFGQNLRVKILREACVGGSPLVTSSQGDRLELDIDIPVVATKHFIPKILGVDLKPYWVVFGGLVFVQVSLPLVSQLDKEADYLRSLIRGLVQTESEEEVIVVADVLSHFINNSYRKYKWNRLTKVNKESIVNMRQLVKSLVSLLENVGETSDRFVELDFYTRANANERRCAVFDIVEVKTTEVEILEKHKIPSWCSVELFEYSSPALAASSHAPQVNHSKRLREME
jgi:ribosomal protein L4